MRRLFTAHFGEGRQLSDHDVLRDAARAAAVPADITEKVVGGDAYAEEVRGWTRPPPRSSR